MDEVNKNIYLSFDWNIKEQAKVLNQKLTDLGYTIFTSESIEPIRRVSSVTVYLLMLFTCVHLIIC